jgi:hypothetical protein
VPSTPRPTLGEVMLGRLKLGRLSLLEAAAGGPAVAGDVGEADRVKAPPPSCFKKDEKPAYHALFPRSVWFWFLSWAVLVGTRPQD